MTAETIDRAETSIAQSWTQKNRSKLPAYVGTVVLLGVAGFISKDLLTARSLIAILTLSTLYSVLGLGQGIVLLTGGIDLSIPALMTFAAVALTSISKGANDCLVWLIPLILCASALVGSVSGFFVAVVRVSPIVVTLGMNAIVTGLLLISVNGTPRGNTPSAISFLMNGRVLHTFPPILLIVAACYVVFLIMLFKTPYGRRIYAVGSSERVAYLTGINVKGILVSVYMINAVMAAVAGMMLAGYSTLSYVGMGDPYLLPSLAVVIVGGGSILGGKGDPIGTLGGALMITFLSTDLSAMLVPSGVRSVFFGVVILLAVAISKE